MEINFDFVNKLKSICLIDGCINIKPSMGLGSAEAITEEFIIENENVIKNAKYVVCQTKINPNVTKQLIELCYENNVPVIMTTSRQENFIVYNSVLNNRN